MDRNTYVMWALILAQLVGLTGWVIKNGPAWMTAWVSVKKQGAEDDLAARKQSVDEAAVVAARLSALETRVQNLGSAATFLANAVTLAVNALEAAEPKNPAISQCRELVAMAASTLGDNDPFGIAIQRLGGVAYTRTKL